jgi:signal transduction histidine kinase
VAAHTDAVSSGQRHPPRAESLALTVALVLYSAALLTWLTLGLLPPLANAFAGVRHWLTTIADAKGLLAGPAGRILDRRTLTAKGGSVVLQYTFSALNLALGFILVAKRPHDRVPRLLAFGLLGTAATFNQPSHEVFHIIGQPWPIKSIHFMFHVVSGVCYLWAVVLFPDGHLPGGLRLTGSRLRLMVVAVTFEIGLVCWRSSFIDHPIFFVIFFGVVVSFSAIAAQAVRLSDPGSTPDERRSARLLSAAFLPAAATAVVWVGARPIVWGGGSIGRSAERLDNSLQSVFPAAFAVVPVVLFVAILRYRLWDIDRILGRVLLIGSVAVVVAVVYVGAVSVVGLIVGGGLLSTVIVLAAMSVAVDPLWRRLRLWYNRLIYGQVLTPAEAVHALVDGLEHLSSSEELQRLAEVVVGATRAVRSEVWLVVEDHLLEVAASPASPATLGKVAAMVLGPGDPDATALAHSVGMPIAVPVVHDDKLLGVLAVESHRGEVLPAVERRLVDELAAHAGLIVRNAVLTAELAHHVEQLSAQADELRRSRRRVIAAQDAERRRLERDLHDGAQQVLVAALMGLRTLTIPADGADGADGRRRAQRQLGELLGSTSETLAELCAGRGPRSLTEHGLATALEAAAELARRSGIETTVCVDLTVPLPPDTTAAVYFSCAEGLQNAAKHARATSVIVTITGDDREVCFEVRDDGIGFDRSQMQRHSGMANLEARLSVVGGSLAVASAIGEGTVVIGRVPVRAGVGIDA